MQEISETSLEALLRQRRGARARLHGLAEDGEPCVRPVVGDQRCVRLFERAKGRRALFRPRRLMLGLGDIDPLAHATEIEEWPGKHRPNEQP